MDYTLRSLREAFQNDYKESKGGFSLYAFLLATSLDQEFVLEYLSQFEELHYLTGKRILIIGPHLDAPREKDQSRIWLHDLRGIEHAIRHSQEQSITNTSDATARFLQFMHDQTRESYDIAQFIGLRTDAMPTLVFFDNLDSPNEYVAWNLFGMNGKEFALALRKLVGELTERCHWDLEDRIRELERSISDERFSWNKPADLKAAEKKLDAIGRTVSFYDQLHALRLAYDRACNNPELRIPREHAGETISLLESGKIINQSFDHLAKHYRRWKSRLPSDYRAALEGFSYPHDLVEDCRMRLSADEAKAELVLVEHQVSILRKAHESKKQKRLIDLEPQLKRARELASNERERPLAVISQFTSTTTITLEHRGSINPRNISVDKYREIPRVFVSYSHDSDRHKGAVVELAQRLRKDGVDCWVDQFEQNPSQGFPRWMLQQIGQADFVLLVCTATYKRRFDGLEDAGRGLGVNFEGHLILQELYDSATLNNKYVPIIFQEAAPQDIPKVLQGYMSYRMPLEYESLYRRVTGQPEIFPRELGTLKTF